MNKRIRTGLVSAVLAVGTLAGVAQISGVANAQVDDTTTTVETTTETADTGTPAADEETEAEREAHREERRAAREATRQAVAELLGMDVEELHEQLHAGATLAELATANGVEVTAVVDLIVEEKMARLDEAVANGRLTADEAAEIAAELETRVQTRVEEGRPERGEGGEGRHGHGHGHGRRGGPAADEAPDAEG
jgi:hypothetical protein